MKTSFDKLYSIHSASAFSKNFYEVVLEMVEIKNTLARFASPLDVKDFQLTDSDFLKLIIPGFQRDNDKWSRDMQIKFVEAIVKGAESTIVLGTYHKTNKRDCRLVDGQQRMTAIIAFLNNEFAIFDDIYANDEDAMRYLSSFGTNMNLRVRIYSFNDEKEMVNFYIEMNENITHSPDDINKARLYLLA